mgnify:CR=1 FL=1|jgi:hypothetical protein
MNQEAVQNLYDFISSPVFLAAFFAWFVAQLLKMIIDVARQRSRTSRAMMATLFWKTGGMPSSHSSLVTALATSIGFEFGISTPLFTLSLFYGILIIRDALGVRRAAGNQARTMNRMVVLLNERFHTEFQPVREVTGHTPAEVSVGVLLGFFIAVAFSFL